MMTGRYKMLKKYLVFVFCILGIGVFTSVFSLNLDKIKESYISGDYKSAIKEGEKMMAGSSHVQTGMDELYYILGLSYLKDGNYLRASDIFEIIVNEFKSSTFINEAKMGLADVYYFKADYKTAEKKYLELLNNKSANFLKAQLYYRLSENAGKLGKINDVKFYQKKLKEDLPLNIEPRVNESILVIKPSDIEEKIPADSSADKIVAGGIYYTVQVGSFASSINAKNLIEELNKKGYAAFIEENRAEDKISYKVKVGKLNYRQEAVDLEAKLAKEGYPTKIYP